MNGSVNIPQGVIEFNDALYPAQLKLTLGKNSPKELYFIGNVDLLKKPAVGFCGSRKASEKGIETAQDCAEQIACKDIVVISGNAAGVDIAAHYTALKSGGSTVFVLPEGISFFRIKSTLKDVWDWSRVLVISQFKPDETWQAFRAMNRNAVIVGLSNAMIVIEAQEKGGTIEAGKSTLKLGMPLFVVEYKDMMQTQGNSILLHKGGHRLLKSQSLGRAQLGTLFETIYEAK